MTIAKNNRCYTIINCKKEMKKVHGYDDIYVDYICLSVRFCSYEGITITGKGLIFWPSCNMLGINGLWAGRELYQHGASVFVVSSKNQIFSFFVQRARGYWGPILSLISLELLIIYFLHNIELRMVISVMTWIQVHM